MHALQENDPRQKAPVPWFDLICVGVAMLALAMVGYALLTVRKDESGQETSGDGGRNLRGGRTGDDRGGVPLPPSGSGRHKQDGQLKPPKGEPAHTAAAGADASSESPAAAQDKITSAKPAAGKESEK
jgi:hypothetical protein